ncbi:MAG: cellulase family glycosylhydrolase [Bacteroidetes bacterium]|nr:cellulase family glycosylhydrolase [Bacteroidota bacterium]
MRITVMLFLLSWLQYSLPGQTGESYVSIEGRQFIDENGNHFYPMVCNYIAGPLYSTADPDNFFLAAEINYDGWGFYGTNTQQLCYEQMCRHFTQIKSMGFNAIRLILQGCPKYRMETITNTGPFFMITAGEPDQINMQCCTTNPPCPCKYMHYTINKPMISNPVAQRLFSQFEEILYIANSVGLKVILVPGGWEDDVQLASLFEVDYTEYLGALSSYFMDTQKTRPEARKALLAYDLMNEPGCSNQTGWYGSPAGHDKHDVCRKTTAWYDAIKANDPAHLVTLGGMGLSELQEWDPAVMKLDFYSVHLYPRRMDFEVDLPADGGFPAYPAIDQLKERGFGRIYFENNQCQMPIIIGEIGFRANNVNPLTPPDVDGNETEQSNYAASTIDYNYHCNGSGYAWWNYQDYFWGGASENCLGLLRYGHCNVPCIGGPNPQGCTDIEKIVVDVFRNSNIVNAIPPSCNQPWNYRDPFNHTRYKKYYDEATSDFNTVHGTVYDDSSPPKPVKEALVKGFTFVGSVQGVSQWHTPYTFTDEQGRFTLVPVQYFSPYYINNVFRAMEISKTGAKTIFMESMNNSTSIQKEGNYYLEKVDPMRFDDSFNHQVIPGNSGEVKVQAWNSLSSCDVRFESGSVGEMSARNSIHLMAGCENDPTKEFWARQNCELHIFNTQTFPACSTLAGIKSASMVSLNADRTSGQRTIDLNFKSATRFGFAIIPNPNNGIFTIKISHGSHPVDEYRLKIFNTLGNMLHEATFRSSQLELNVSEFAKGVYTVMIQSKDDQQSKKLIIN